MDGRYLRLVRDVIKRVVMNGDGFTTDLSFTDKQGNIFEIKGLAIVHSTVVDTDNTGKYQALSDTSSVTFCESDLTDAGAVTRKSDGTFSMSGWIVAFTLPSGDYVASISETLPDSTLNVTRCLINIYGQD